MEFEEYDLNLIRSFVKREEEETFFSDNLLGDKDMDALWYAIRTIGIGVDRISDHWHVPDVSDNNIDAIIAGICIFGSILDPSFKEEDIEFTKVASDHINDWADDITHDLEEMELEMIALRDQAKAADAFKVLTSEVEKYLDEHPDHPANGGDLSGTNRNNCHH